MVVVERGRAGVVQRPSEARKQRISSSVSPIAQDRKGGFRVAKAAPNRPPTQRWARA
jgi:hypothetical protein